MRHSIAAPDNTQQNATYCTEGVLRSMCLCPCSRQSCITYSSMVVHIDIDPCICLHNTTCFGHKYPFTHLSRGCILTVYTYTCQAYHWRCHPEPASFTITVLSRLPFSTVGPVYSGHCVKAATSLKQPASLAPSSTKLHCTKTLQLPL